MEKNKDLNNKLIKKKNLNTLLKKQGINNIEKKSLETIEKYIQKEIKNLSLLFKDEMVVNGRRTLKNRDVLKVLKEQENKNDFQDMEIF